MNAETLATYYSRFRVTERILLTGHSHQAWPDVAFTGLERAFADAALHVDDKWGPAQEAAREVGRGFAKLLGEDDARRIALGQNTHELVTRFLSALPLRKRPRLVTTDGEFHTLRRQLDRLAEEGVEIVKVAARPVSTLSERLALALNDETAAVLVSSVLFETSEVVADLGHVALACALYGTELLIDAYHHLNALPFNLTGLTRAFVVGGGYKYCQLGEGNCFLRVPPDCTLRPVLTGWFAEHATLAQKKASGEVSYGVDAERFAGATYDPTSHYRARVVFDFFAQKGLTPRVLREINQRQIALLIRAFTEHDVDPKRAELVDIAPSLRGGFLAVRSPDAQELTKQLRAHDVWTDARGVFLRLGPAPYLSDTQLRDAVSALCRLLKQ